MPHVGAVLTIAFSDMSPGLGDLIEEAQTLAVKQALTEGISVYDSDEIRYRKALAQKATVAAYHHQHNAYALSNGTLSFAAAQQAFANHFNKVYAELKALSRDDVLWS